MQDVDSANYKRLHGEPVPILTGKIVGGERIDSRLDAAVRKACAEDPAERYQTAKEFYDALVLAEVTEKEGTPAGNLEPTVPVQEWQQEKGQPETGAKPSDSLESTVPVQGWQQEKERSGPEGRTPVVPPPIGELVRSTATVLFVGVMVSVYLFRDQIAYRVTSPPASAVRLLTLCWSV